MVIIMILLILAMKIMMSTPIALVIVVVGNHIGGRGRMIDTTDEAAGANQIQIQDLKSSKIFIHFFMTMMLL